MADYWKSQARKYCNFCKCWIADNKPSIQYHESGKRHKENVAKKISVLAKQSAKQYKENAKLDEEMKKMEEEALKAYRMDIESNADWTGREVMRRLGEKAEAEDGKKKKKKKGKEDEKPLTIVVKETEPVWREERTEEGHVYYWNTATSESKWEPPTEPYLSLKEKKAKESEEKKRSKQEERNRQKEMADEVKAFCTREQMKLKYGKADGEGDDDGDGDGEEAAARKETVGRADGKKAKRAVAQPYVKKAQQAVAQPYGKWTTVVRTDDKPIDYQLPARPICEKKASALATVASLLASVVDEEEGEGGDDDNGHPAYRIKIEEKTVGSYSADADADACADVGLAFKKRKLNNRGNMRQRRDDDYD